MIYALKVVARIRKLYTALQNVQFTETDGTHCPILELILTWMRPLIV